MWYNRSIIRISLLVTEKKSNQKLMEMPGYKRSPLKTIRKRQLQFFGHINRADGIDKQILSGKIYSTKGRGRQRTKYTDSLNLPTMITSGEPTTERIGRPWSQMSATNLVHDDDDDSRYSKKKKPSHCIYHTTMLAGQLDSK